MRFHKVISTILHPIVIPTLGTLLYFMFVSESLLQNQRLMVLALIFVVTYFIPLIVLILLKTLGFIRDFQVSSIKERKFPVIFMIFLFYLLGNILAKTPALRDLGFLFYGTSLSLLLIYFLFAFQIKSSLHLVSMGNGLGFFLILSNVYSLSLTPLIIILILLSGLLASSRLYLKAHTAKELVFGFFIGIVSQLAIFLFL